MPTPHLLALWPPGQPEAAGRHRRWLWLALVAYVAAVLLVIPPGIGASWRECDTQAIARNFLNDGFNPLRPRIDWRGTTDGAVECEFPLYQSMIATVMAAVGESEWPGRALSLLAMVVATLSLHRLLERRSGPAGALAGALVFLTGGHAFLLGSRVMPDALSTALALAGLTSFTQFLMTGRSRTLWLATAATALASLAKPTALQVVPLQFLWALMLAPRRLLEMRVWLAGMLVPAVVAAWLWHAHQLYAETGLTFGVTAGGETKFPTIERLLDPAIWTKLAQTTMHFGLSPLGAVAALWLLLRRRLDRTDLALLAVVAAGLVGTLRYSYHGGIGPHYHVFAAVAGSWLVARAFPVALPTKRLAPLWLLLLAAVASQGAWHLRWERDWRQRCLDGALIETGAQVAALSTPNDLLVVRGPRERVDALWRRRTNFEEPVLHYHARRRGWVLPRDGFEPSALAELQRQGARLVVDQSPHNTSQATADWLSAHSEHVADGRGGRIYRLHPVEATLPPRGTTPLR